MEVLIIAHGSRHRSHADAFKQLLHQVQALQPDTELHYGFLNYCEPNALDQLMKLGHQTDRIILLPLFLGKASHVLQDIPDIVAKTQRHFPDLNILTTEILGCPNELTPALHNELKSLCETSQTDISSSKLLLLGRGSSVTDSLQFIFDLKNELTLPFKNIEVSFWDIAEPSFEQALQDFLDSDDDHLTLQPLFLFPGVLLDKCQQMLNASFQNLKGKQVTLGRPLSSWVGIPEMIQQRIQSKRSLS